MTKPIQMDIHEASMTGSYYVLKRLLEESTDDIDKRNRYGHTPLWYSAKKGYLDCIQLLLKYGSDPTIKDNNGDSPIDIARFYGHKECHSAMMTITI